MNWLEFFANLIDNVLSWPVAVLLIVLLLRKQLRELFRTVENFVLEHGGTRVSFTRSLERAREGVAAAKAEARPRLREASSDDPESKASIPALEEEPSSLDATAAKEAEYLAEQYSHAWKLARRNPSRAIEFAWDRLVAEQVRRLAQDRGLRPADATHYVLNELNSRGVVNDDIAKSANTLNEMRFRVATADGKPTRKHADQYIEVAWEVANYLSYLRSEDAKSQSP
jgi:hypothetical protein